MRQIILITSSVDHWLYDPPLTTTKLEVFRCELHWIFTAVTTYNRSLVLGVYGEVKSQISSIWQTDVNLISSLSNVICRGIVVAGCSAWTPLWEGVWKAKGSLLHPVTQREGFSNKLFDAPILPIENSHSAHNKSKNLRFCRDRIFLADTKYLISKQVNGSINPPFSMGTVLDSTRH